MKKLSTTVLVLFLVMMLTAPGTLRAEFIDIYEGGVQFYAPEGWSAEFDGSGWMVQSPDDGSVSMFLVILESEDIEDAIDEAMASVYEVVGEISFQEELDEGEINGYNYVELHGVAMDGMMRVSLTLLETEEENLLMIGYFAVIELEKIWAEDLAEFINSYGELEEITCSN